MNHALWYATRATGVVALVLLTLVVALGVAGSLRFRSERWPRFVVTGLHRNLTLLALAFLAGHVGTTVLDSYTPIRLRDAVIPFVSSYRPIWLGLGAVAFDLLLALTVTSLLRARIGYRTWRSLHWLAYAAWPVALVHGLGTGSDARFGWLQTVALACVALVATALVRRIATAAVSAERRLVAAAAAVACLTFGALWYGSGPGARGWAARAGTPAAALARPAAARAAAPVSHAAATVDLPATPFTAQLAGSISSTVDQATGLVRIDIRTHTRGRVRGLLWIRLQGEPVDNGGVSMTASGVAFGPPSAPNRYVGSITALQGTELAVDLRDAAGRHLSLQVALSVDQATRHVSGTVQAS